MLVSIVIPSFRQPQFLARAIESCLDQDHQDLEVIVVDDRSGDSSLGLAVSYSSRDSRVKVVSCPTNGGLGAARNIGIGHANGEVLCFLDSDDYLLDRSLSARIEAFPAARTKYGAAVAGVYGDWQHVPEDIDHPVVRQPRATMPLVSAGTYTGENVFICSAPLVYREAVVAAGGFPEGLAMLEDFALWAKMIATGYVFVPVHHVVSTYRQRPNSMLRGDGVVVMSDHVEVINDWVTNEGVALADGGAMSAWLENRDPRSYGRMSWSVPSILGSFGGAPDASAVADVENDGHLQSLRNPVADFMAAPPSAGLSAPPPVWAGDPSVVDRHLLVSTLDESLAAVSLVAEARDADLRVGVAADAMTSWAVLWPLALANIDVVIKGDHEYVDFGTLALLPPQVEELVSDGIARLWDQNAERSGSCVFVPHDFATHPALDAWLSTALHALAERGEAPFVMADPRGRGDIRGFRSEVTSIERLLSVSVVVAPQCDQLGVLKASAPVLVFDPSRQVGSDARTKAELDASLSGLDRTMAPRVSSATFIAELIQRLAN